MSYPPPVPYDHGRPTTKREMLSAIVATTDINALVSNVAEAYRLTVSLDRDVAEIEAHYRNLEQTNRQLHDEIMAALAGRFTERAAQIAFVERATAQLIERGEYQTAHSIISQLMKLLQQSPVEEAFSRR